MKRPRFRPLGYRAAIRWLAANDDTYWLEDEDPLESVATALVADIFGREVEEVTADLRRAVARHGRGSGQA